MLGPSPHADAVNPAYASLYSAGCRGWLMTHDDSCFYWTILWPARHLRRSRAPQPQFRPGSLTERGEPEVQRQDRPKAVGNSETLRLGS